MPFVTSVFTISLVFSTSLPLILVVGLIFFMIKFSTEFNQRVILNKKMYFSADFKHSNTTVRGSLVKFLFSSCVLYLLINSLIFTASPNSKILCYCSLVALGIAFVVTVYFWKKWRLSIDPKVGKKIDD